MIKLISAAKPLKGSISLPPDKSIAQRAALFALLSESTSTISNYPEAEDPQTALSCIGMLGAEVIPDSSEIEIKGVGRDGLTLSGDIIDCGNSGTVMRLLSGILAGSGVQATLIGDASLSSRPMKRIMDPLSRMGAEITSADGGYPPLHLNRKGPLKPMRYTLPVASAQLKSCILLAGLFGDDVTEVVEPVPCRNHTETMLRLPVDHQNGHTVISSYRGLELPSQNLVIPGDFSAAAFWLVAATIVDGSDLMLPATGMNPTRNVAIDILKRMGADITIRNIRTEGAEPVADLQVRSTELRAVTIRPEEVPVAIDELPILSVAMAFADGTSRITGAEELRYKESDRLSAMGTILENAGIRVEVRKDGLIIQGRSGKPGKSTMHDSMNDHRIAMSAAILSLKTDGVSEIRNAGAASVSYPDFWSHLDSVAH